MKLIKLICIDPTQWIEVWRDSRGRIDRQHWVNGHHAMFKPGAGQPGKSFKPGRETVKDAR